jgi:hypothetical protein
LQHRHVGHRGLETLGQHDGHTIAALHPEQPQRIGQTSGVFSERRKAVVLGLALARPIFNHRRGRAPLGVLGPALHAHLRDVEAPGHTPAKAPVEGLVVVRRGLGLVVQLTRGGPHGACLLDNDANNVPSSSTLAQHL